MSIELISNIENDEYKEKTNIQSNKSKINPIEISHQNKHSSIDEQIALFKDQKNQYLYRPSNMQNRNTNKNNNRLACEIVKSCDRIVSANAFISEIKDPIQSSIQAINNLKESNAKYIQAENQSRNTYISENQMFDRFGSRFVNPKMYKRRYRNQLNLKLVFSSAAPKINTKEDSHENK